MVIPLSVPPPLRNMAAVPLGKAQQFVCTKPNIQAVPPAEQSAAGSLGHSALFVSSRFFPLLKEKLLLKAEILRLLWTLENPKIHPHQIQKG